MNNRLPPDVEPPITLKGVRILVIEDAWQIGEATKSFLQLWGAEVTGPVATKAHADSLLSETTFDIALVDLGLRDERADALINRLNDLGVSVLVISGYESCHARQRAAAGILNKPCTNAQLLTALQELAKQRRDDQRAGLLVKGPAARRPSPD